MGGHWLRLYKVKKMAKLQYIGKERSRSLVKGGKISPKETVTVDAKIALVYLNDNNFKITFDALDRATLNTCSSTQYKWLQREFKGKTLNETLDKMFKPTPKKSRIPKKIKDLVPKTAKETKGLKLKHPVKPVTKPMVLKKNLKDSEL